MYNMETLGQLTGLTRRTIRYYIQRGLLDAPEGGGRGSFYTEQHLQRLQQIKEWTAQGVPIIRIKAMLEGRIEQFKLDTATAVQITLWERFKILEGIELHYNPGSLSHADLRAVKDFIIQLKELNQENQGGKTCTE